MDEEHKFQNYLLKTIIVEISTISIEGMDNPVIYFYMTVYVRTISEKTDNQHKMRKETKHYENQG